jgi:hypothetical protein
MVVAYYLVTCLLLAALGAGLVSVYDVVRAQGFTEVEGEILGQDVSRVKRHTGQKRTGRTKYLHVSYSYVFEGKTYEGDRIHPGTFGLTSGSDLKTYGSRFTPGTKVMVHVDPADPATAVLLTGFSNITILLGVISGFLLVPFLVLRALVNHPAGDASVLVST